MLDLIKMNSGVAVEMDKTYITKTITGKESEQLGHF